LNEVLATTFVMLGSKGAGYPLWHEAASSVHAVAPLFLFVLFVSMIDNPSQI
jgi:hypothetical protein